MTDKYLLLNERERMTKETLYLYNDVVNLIHSYCHCSGIKPPKTHIDILNNYNIYTDEQILTEYKLIEQKQSNLPRKVRDLISKLIIKHNHGLL